MDSVTAKKHKMGNICAALVVVLCILIVLGILYGLTALLWVTCIVNFIAGPACLIGYLNEVRKGIFSNDDEYDDDVIDDESV